MKLRIALPLLSIFAFFTILAYTADDDPFTALLKKLEVYNEKNPQEKVHLHLDKPYYAIGDDIWFKAYIINAQTSKPSDLSGILYVELINEKDSLKKQVRLPVIAGLTWGDFKLPDTLSEGNYRIRAYTQWMRNMGTEFFFDKTIKIGNSWANSVFTNTNYSFSKQNQTEKIDAKIRFSDKDGNPYVQKDVSYEVELNFRNQAKGKATTNEQGEINISFLNTQPSIYKSGKIVTTIYLPENKKVIKNIPVKATSNAVDVQFFPESGNLVENLPNKIGIKATNASGLGEDITGTVVDNDGTEINTFGTQHLGMGSLIVNPQPGKVYTAKVKFKDGSEKTINLPKSLPSGYILTTNNSSDNLTAKVLLSENLVGTSELKLVAQHNGNVYFVSKTSSSKQIFITNIPKKDLPSGIIQLTLFSGDNTPLCERLVFIKNPDDNIKTSISSSKTTYQRKEKVDIDIQAAVADKPVQGSFSVSVTNTASVKPDEENETNIFTSLLLTSDIVGYVEKPNYYFLNSDSKTQQDLDNLLLTQGWRRFIWKNVINDLAPIIRYQPEKALKISGILTTYGGKPVPKGKISLFSSSGGFFATDTLTDEQGRFSFEPMSFNDSTKFIVQARNAKDKKHVDIKLDVTDGQIITKSKNNGDIEINVNEALSGYLRKSSSFFDELTKRGLLEKTITLKEVSIVEKKDVVKNSSNLSRNADAVITAEQLQNCTTISQCLMGRVAGLIFRNGIPYLMRNGNTPMHITLDGMQIEPETLDNINVTDVEGIEVLKSIGNTAIYGSNGGGGVLVITTKRGGGFSSASTFVPGIITYSPKGYSIPRQFYSPKYDVPNSATDSRTTIYWAPHISTNESGKGQFSFYNSNESGTYRVVVEGIDMAGNLARSVYTYEVK
ncbi:TonB-dependent receptor plug domain-containing protein [Pedobacter frigoris]|uniref:TonB-dependent receptor plug domain-containing protein n=1 Tax=Pedobacter frigoris TaxID=2571272 RepID=UPI00292CC825|nr:TonB-dependent receptor plug domain-containing protein [Pedobacter frigoris]